MKLTTLIVDPKRTTREEVLNGASNGVKVSSSGSPRAGSGLIIDQPSYVVGSVNHQASEGFDCPTRFLTKRRLLLGGLAQWGTPSGNPIMNLGLGGSSGSPHEKPNIAFSVTQSLVTA